MSRQLKLNRLQKLILTATLTGKEAQVKRDGYASYWGVSIGDVRQQVKTDYLGKKTDSILEPVRGPKVWTRSNAADLSSSLERLERRALIICHNDWSGGTQTNCVFLTPEGEAAAKQLNG